VTVVPSDEQGVMIREMTPADADRVGQLTLASYDRYGRITGPYRTFLAEPARRADGVTSLLVAELDGAVVGTVSFVLPSDREWEGPAEPDGDAAFRVLAVDSDVEGRGVGRRLVERCLELAREHGCRRIVISSMAWMDRAHRLYLDLGFARRRDLDVRFPGGDGVVFTYDLTPDAADHFRPPGPVPDQIPWFEDVWER
jgi:GNAT superfamily N-acetyltransferase